MDRLFYFEFPVGTRPHLSCAGHIVLMGIDDHVILRLICADVSAGVFALELE